MAENDGQQTEGGTLRQRLEETLATLKTVTEERDTDRKELLFYRADLGHLTDRRRRMLLNSFDDPAKVTADDLKQAAKEEGWHKPAKDDKEDPKKRQAGQNGQQQQQVDENDDPDNDNPDGQPDDQWPDDGLPEGLDDIERAMIASHRGVSGAMGQSFEDALKGAKSQEEVANLLRTRGPGVGVVLDEI